MMTPWGSFTVYLALVFSFALSSRLKRISKNRYYFVRNDGCFELRILAKASGLSRQKQVVEIRKYPGAP